MKKITLFAAAATFAALALSCTKDAEPNNLAPKTVPLTVNVGTVTTKALVNGSEDLTLNNLQIIVYDASGQLEKSSELAANKSSITLEVLPGRKTVWAVANILSKIDESSIPTPDDLSSIVCDFSISNLSGMTMTGSADKIVSLEDSQLNLTIRHLASKVVIDGIKRDFDNDSYSVIPLIIRKIYMGNVAGNCNYGCDMSMPTLWYNKLGVVQSDLPASVKAMTVDDGLNISLPEGGSYNTKHTFYVFPNPSTEDVYGGTWSPRRTRLVLECDYGGRTCYYPVTLPKDPSAVIERNKVYHISLLKLTKPGSLTPDDPNTEVASTIGFTVNVQVSDWEGDTSYTEEY